MSDPDGKVASAYGIYNPQRKIPARVTFIIDKEGKIALIDRSVRVATHGADIARKLEELGVEKR